MARKRAASKLVLHVSTKSTREAVLDARTSWPRMVIRLLCMMIDALRCAGIAYFYGMMRSFFLPLYLCSRHPNTFHFLFQPVLRPSISDVEKKICSMQQAYSRHEHAVHLLHKAKQDRR